LLDGELSFESVMARVNHASLYATDPKRVAELLAKIAGGRTAPFHAIEGGWFCFLDDEGALVELYPRTITLAHENGAFKPKKLAEPAKGGGAHVNISVDLGRGELERRCDALGVPHSWREWQSLLEVWPEDDVLFEIVPRAD
jgi:hypothetical protein